MTKFLPFIGAGLMAVVNIVLTGNTITPTPVSKFALWPTTGFSIPALTVVGAPADASIVSGADFSVASSGVVTCNKDGWIVVFGECYFSTSVSPTPGAFRELQCFPCISGTPGSWGNPNTTGISDSYFVGLGGDQWRPEEETPANGATVGFGYPIPVTAGQTIYMGCFNFSSKDCTGTGMRGSTQFMGYYLP